MCSLSMLCAALTFCRYIAMLPVAGVSGTLSDVNFHPTITHLISILFHFVGFN
jgi:hypothetical protein